MTQYELCRKMLELGLVEKGDDDLLKKKEAIVEAFYASVKDVTYAEMINTILWNIDGQLDSPEAVEMCYLGLTIGRQRGRNR